MKNLKEIFLNIASEEEINDVLSYYSVELPENYYFSDVNIVIGSNGSGKTRFLKALFDLYSKNRTNQQIIYGYFPGLRDKKTDNDSSSLPAVTLYEAKDLNQISFPDFLKEIEERCDAFLEEIVTYGSERQKANKIGIVKNIEESFSFLTDKQIEYKPEEKKFIITTDNQKLMLSQELKRFSPGELMLFYISIFLSIQNDTFKNKVIILDEPEIHLRPKALIRFVNLLKCKRYYIS